MATKPGTSFQTLNRRFVRKRNRSKRRSFRKGIDDVTRGRRQESADGSSTFDVNNNDDDDVGCSRSGTSWFEDGTQLCIRFLAQSLEVWRGF
jgi:hypothetical protein